MQSTKSRIESQVASPNLRLDDRFIKNIQGKDFVLYAGLLDLAHQKGLIKLEVETLQFPSKENNNTAVCRATAVSELGETFTDIGDADPSNVNRMISPHIIRMASTRAKARCLRDFCNIGMTCLEELADEADIPGELNGHKTNGNGHRSAKQSPSPTPSPTNTSVTSISESQKRAILNLAKRNRLSDEQLNAAIQGRYQRSLDDLSKQQASELIQSLQNGN